jgi:NAD(P)-dependent dehydrogenase (short-subunit alcohol dehydrogenase family)
MQLQNQRTWLITGGASGIGKCLVKYLSEQHQKVVFIDMDVSKAQTTLKQMNNELVTYIVCDLADQTSIDEAVLTIKNQKIHVDVLVHNAAIGLGGIHQASYDDFLKTLKVNLIAPFYLTQQLLPHFTEKASVINIASTRAFQSQQNTEAYTASKGGLISLTHAMGISLEGKIRVNCISPGWIDTSSCFPSRSTFSQDDHLQHPSKRIGAPNDIIKAVLYLADVENDFINGQNIIIDGGMTKRMIYHHDEGWTYHEQ